MGRADRGWGVTQNAVPFRSSRPLRQHGKAGPSPEFRASSLFTGSNLSAKILARTLAAGAMMRFRNERGAIMLTTFFRE